MPAALLDPRVRADLGTRDSVVAFGCRNWYKNKMMLSTSRIMRTAVAAALALVLAAAPLPAVAGGVYFVKKGDTLARVGRLFGVGVDDILAANPLAGTQLGTGASDPRRRRSRSRGAWSNQARASVDPERVRWRSAARRRSTTRWPG
jgi:hypothetical protein